MKISDVFPSKFLRASDLRNGAVKVTVEKLHVEEINGEYRPVLHFQGKKKRLPLNKTNAREIANRCGEETDNWDGAEMTLYSTEVEYKGSHVPAIRVRDVSPPVVAREADGDNTAF
jgi:hypothetical protein